MNFNIRLLILTLMFFPIPSLATRVAITFDDLPLHGLAPRSTSRIQIAQKILATLKAHNVKEAYGFVNAYHLENATFKSEGLLILDAWNKGGHPLANHTYSHRSLMRGGSEQGFISDIEWNEPILKLFAKDQEWKFFRYPFLHEGETQSKRDIVRRYLFSRGYQIAQVTIDFSDWAWNTPYTRCVNRGKQRELKTLQQTYITRAKQALASSLAVTSPLFHPDFPQVLLLHLGAFTAEQLDALLTEYESQGVEFIPLAEALKDSRYQIDPGVTFPEGALFQDQVMKFKGISLQSLSIKETPFQDFTKKLEQICR